MKHNFNQATIMVVDDKPANLNYLVDILSEQGYKVRVFPGGKLALKSAEHNPPNLILLDINMPELNGYEVCVMLKAHPILKNIPVIFISALIDTRDKIKAFECGGVDYITKPFEPEEVKARVKTHLSLAQVELLESEINKRIQTEKQYYAQLDNFADAIIHTNQTGEIVYCNPVTEKYFGYTISELIGQHIEILIPKEQQQTHIQHRKNYLQAPSNRQMESVKNIFARMKDGKTFPVDIILSSLYSEEGLLVSAEIRDISEQHQLKTELETQRQFFDDAFSKTPDGIALTNAQGLILLANPSLSRMLGYQVDELIGKHIKFLFDDINVFDNIASQKSGSDSNAIEKFVTVNFQRKDSNILPTEISVIPVKDRLDKKNGHFIVIRDISERLLMEQEHKSLVKQLMQAQKMEALGQLTGGVAHDFNNILASIMGFTELATDLLEDEEDLAKQEARKIFTDYLDEIHIAGKRAKTLIEQMLTFSRSGKNDTLQPFNISILVNEAIKMLRPVLPTSISINAYVQSNISMVMADPVQLHQVLMNICINARDAMAGKGRIEITLGETIIPNEICTACQQPVTGNYLELAIEDSGPGIDTRVIERLFEPFFTTKKVGKGTGMGLAMAHGIIHRHQGHIIVESVVGTGSKFRILFPQPKEKTVQQDGQTNIEHETA